MRVWKQTWKVVLVAALGTLCIPAVAWAVSQSSSPHFQVNEVFFGSGGELNACSTNFCSKQAIGESAVGKTASTNFQAQGGFNTDRNPYIEFDVSNTNVDLGTLSPNTTQTTTATFSVKAYLAHGYVVTNASDPPSNGSYTMQSLTIPTASQTGTEQFGINLVANTVPTSFGADPSYTPDTTFSFGQVTPDYDTANMYKYLKGDVVAQSFKSSSYTTYTVSYLFNISNVTPGGSYLFRHVLIATATY